MENWILFSPVKWSRLIIWYDYNLSHLAPAWKVFCALSFPYLTPEPGWILWRYSGANPAAEDLSRDGSWWAEKLKDHKERDLKGENKCEKIPCPSSIRCRDLNIQHLKHESSAITTRPELQSCLEKNTTLTMSHDYLQCIWIGIQIFHFAWYFLQFFTPSRLDNFHRINFYAHQKN